MHEFSRRQTLTGRISTITTRWFRLISVEPSSRHPGIFTPTCYSLFDYVALLCIVVAHNLRRRIGLRDAYRW
ncbi:MAG: hypothetical protein ACOYMG_03455, partial [Candidatus Methylumidiphilus sp.]